MGKDRTHHDGGERSTNDGAGAGTTAQDSALAFDPTKVELALRELEDDKLRTGRALDAVDLQRAAARHALSVIDLAVLELRAESAGLLPVGAAPSWPARVRPRPDVRSPIAVSSLGEWMRAAGRYPVLKQEQEVALARAIEAGVAARGILEQSGDLPASVQPKLEALVDSGVRAKALFVESNLRLVASIARHFDGRGLDLLDLLQEGVLGVVRAVEKFDWRLGYKFSTYATWWIRQSMQRAIDNDARAIRIPVWQLERIRDLKRRRSQLESRFGREPSVAELATELGLDLAEVAFLHDLGSEVMSLDRRLGPEHDGLRLVDLVADTSNPFEDVVRDTTYQDLVARFLALLTARERDVLIRRFGLDDGAPDTLEQIGNSLGVTRERIRQIEARALKKLSRSELAARSRTAL